MIKKLIILLSILFCIGCSSNYLKKACNELNDLNKDMDKAVKAAIIAQKEGLLKESDVNQIIGLAEFIENTSEIACNLDDLRLK